MSPFQVGETDRSGFLPIGFADLLVRLPVGVEQEASCLGQRIGFRMKAFSKARRSRAA